MTSPPTHSLTLGSAPEGARGGEEGNLGMRCIEHFVFNAAHPQAPISGLGKYRFKDEMKELNHGKQSAR
jgi:hypothetical protein